MAMHAPLKVSVGSILGETNERIGSLYGSILPPAVALAVLTGVDFGGGTAETEITAALIYSAIIVGPIMGALVFALYVWMFRRLAPGLGIEPRDISAGSVLAAGYLMSLLIIIGLIMLVLPGLAALVVFSIAAPIVAYEGIGGWTALRESARTVTKFLGTFICLVVVLMVVPVIVDPGMWTVNGEYIFGLSKPAVMLIQLVLYTFATIYSTISFAIACKHARSAAHAATVPHVPVAPPTAMSGPAY